jgi:hypothetical protein
MKNYITKFINDNAQTFVVVGVIATAIVAIRLIINLISMIF